MGLVAGIDRTQRRVPFLGIPLAVLYKYMDDQGNYLAAMITYYAFIAIFPLLLLASSILGFFLQSNPHLANEVLNSALAQFPIVGDQLGRPGGLKGSVGGVVVGAAAALYGSLGLGQAIQNAMNVGWSVPRNKRPNPIRLRLRSLALLIISGVSILGITAVSTIGTNGEVYGPRLDDTLRWLLRIATILLLGGLLTIIFRLATARRHQLGRAAPGAFVVAILWQALQYAGTIYADRVIGETAEGMNRIFALVLGLIGIIYIAAVMGMIGIEVNVVLARRLWPRSLASLFTDNKDLTEADLRAYAGYIRAQQHKEIEHVEVSFVDPTTGEIRIPQEAGRPHPARKAAAPSTAPRRRSSKRGGLLSPRSEPPAQPRVKPTPSAPGPDLYDEPHPPAPKPAGRNGTARPAVPTAARTSRAEQNGQAEQNGRASQSGRTSQNGRAQQHGHPASANGVAADGAQPTGVPSDADPDHSTPEPTRPIPRISRRPQA